MSLLMQALKKAEQAKKQSAGDGINPNPPALASELPNPPTLQAQSPVAFGLAEAGSELLSDLTFSFKPVEQKAQTEPTATPGKKQIAENQDQTARQADGEIQQSQQIAQTLFSAKQPMRSNRFVLVAGSGVAVTIFCMGLGFFYYWQRIMLYPDLPPVSTTQDLRKANTLHGDQPAAASSAPALTLDESSLAKESPTMGDRDNAGNVDSKDSANKLNTTKRDGVMQTGAEFDSDSVPTQAKSTSPAMSRTLSLRQREQVAEAAATDQIQIHKNSIPPAINSDLMNAYRLFSSGDVNSARPLYENVLRKDPNNRDALLGIAAIALNQNQSDRAASVYSQLLDLNPSDPDAIAGLTSIRHGDPGQSESQLKKVLAQNSQSAPTLFELGNLYMQSERWSEAQEIYFRAFGASPQNPDYAFNLAVSLDRLGQGKLANDYYERALALSKAAPSKFSQDAAKGRIIQLQQVTGTNQE